MLLKARDFVERIPVVPFGVLGHQLSAAGTVVDGRGPDPAAVPGGCCFVDPSGLHNVLLPGGPKAAIREAPRGAAASIYRWLGTDGDEAFPAEVTANVRATGDARLCAYARGAGTGGAGGAAHVIHAVGPDFRKPRGPYLPPYSRADAVEFLR